MNQKQSHVEPAVARFSQKQCPEGDKLGPKLATSKIYTKICWWDNRNVMRLKFSALVIEDDRSSQCFLMPVCSRLCFWVSYIVWQVKFIQTCKILQLMKNRKVFILQVRLPNKKPVKSVLNPNQSRCRFSHLLNTDVFLEMQAKPGIQEILACAEQARLNLMTMIILGLIPPNLKHFQKQEPNLVA